jgi:hypothetical protein
MMVIVLTGSGGGFQIYCDQVMLLTAGGGGGGGLKMNSSYFSFQSGAGGGVQFRVPDSSIINTREAIQALDPTHRGDMAVPDSTWYVLGGGSDARCDSTSRLRTQTRQDPQTSHAINKAWIELSRTLQWCRSHSVLRIEGGGGGGAGGGGGPKGCGIGYGFSFGANLKKEKVEPISTDTEKYSIKLDLSELALKKGMEECGSHGSDWCCSCSYAKSKLIKENGQALAHS